MSDPHAPSPLPKYLYKMLPTSSTIPPLSSPEAEIPSTPLDQKDNFIHLSTPKQVSYVLNRFFTGEDQKDIWLLKVDYEKLCNGKGKIQWDPAGQEGDVFPHLYDAELVTGVIVGVEKVVRDDGWDGALEGLRESGWLV